ncbi:concanavalin A-like lectin/glucanase [Thozetella sp. PMI_491]|nr:concanavalin A-like lectin/glucanase [Thozetella sp. PMI_491]
MATRTAPGALRLLPSFSRPALFSQLLSFLLLQLASVASADCECGYATTINGAATPYVFTDLIESDFAKTNNISANADWVRQAFNLTNTRARGDYGEMFSANNVAANPSGATDPGLALMVRAQRVEGMVPVAEIDTERMDLFWGSFRASLKLSKTPGTCAAFFWYFNDTAEIDMEFLNKDFNTNNNSYPVNLVLQSREAAEAGYDAQRTGNFIKAYLPFNPTDGFHEYRIDYVPGRVLFYADGKLLAQMNGSAVPSSSGHLILQHWSNGNALWSGGPPTLDAVLTVKYVKAYFNSSSATRNRDWKNRCINATATGAVCKIPEVSETNTTAGGWFFSGRDNMTNNQTISGRNEGGRLSPVLWATPDSRMASASRWLPMVAASRTAPSTLHASLLHPADR